MIEVNLVPDVKRELLKAQRIRNIVIFSSVVVAIAAVVITIILAVTVYMAQALISSNADKTIDSEFGKLQSSANVNEILTIQDQLAKLEALSNDKTQFSRIFGILDVILPTGDNQVSISELKFDQETNTVSFDGQAEAGYIALEALQKTIESTTIEFLVDEETIEKGELLNGEVQVGDTSYGRNSEGRLVLRFNISFPLSENVLMFKSRNMKIIGPTKQNVTDSFVQIPDGMFEEAATDLSEEERKNINGQD